MTAHRPDQAELHARLGYQPLYLLWAKVEILLGLGTAGAGLFVGQWALFHSTALDWYAAIAGWAFFVLGSYLALAGHRSHLYRSLNDLTALLLDELRKSISKGHSS